MAGPADEVAEEARRLRAEILTLESGSDEQLRLYHEAVTVTQWSSMLHQNVDELDEMLHIVLNGIRSATHAGRALFPLNEDLLAGLAGAALCHIERFDYRYEMSDLDEAERYAWQVLDLGAGREVDPTTYLGAYLALGRSAGRKTALGLDPQAVHRAIPGLRDCVERYSDAFAMAVLARCLRISVADPEMTAEDAVAALSEAGGLLATLLAHPAPDIPVAGLLSGQWLAELALVHYAAHVLSGSEPEREAAVQYAAYAMNADPRGPEVALVAAVIDGNAAGYRRAMHLATRNAFVFVQATAGLAYALYADGDRKGVGDAALSALPLLHDRAERQVLDEDKVYFMRRIDDLVALAAPALAASRDRIMPAIEHVERARTRILRERFPDDESQLFALNEVRPDLATPLRRALETLRSPDVSMVARGLARDSLMYHQFEARQVPGFERFRDVPAMDGLRLDAPLVYLVPGHPEGVAFVLHPDRAPSTHPLPACPRSPVPEPVAAFQQATYGGDWPAGARKAAVTAVAAWAWAALYAPIRQALDGYPYAHVVLASYLAGVPLHAARSPDGTYALQELDIRYVPSATALLTALGRLAPTHEPKLLAIPQPAGAGRQLANARAELHDIAAYFPDARVLAPERVDRASITRGLAGVGMFHAACHGLADPHDPLASGLELANGERFTLRDLFGQPRDHLLVAVLSACQTNVPDLSLPDEAISLASGLLAGGCRSVVASAWQVPDTATADLMRGMYRRWREDGVSLPEALRAAQIEASGRPPYYWAGFSYSGA